MSAQNFLERIRTDQEFAGLFNKTMTSGERLTLVKESGYDCTQEDLKQAINQIELSETELDRIAAGVNQVSGDGSCPDCWFW
jgi:predicted ribosomally synthesized peptide with nif11-like leader